MNKLAVRLLAALVLLAGSCGSVFAAPGAPAAASASPVTVMTEGFEGAWPSAGWTIKDLSNDGFQRYWGTASTCTNNCMFHSGARSAWPASGGAQWVDPVTGLYPDNLNSQMVFGPFDLSDAVSANVTFWLWAEIEVQYDYLYFGSSADGATYNQEGTWEGSLDWSLIDIDLTRYAGDPSVWVRWDFFSDTSVGLAGPFIDDVTISKQVLVAPVVSIKRSGSSDIRLDWPANADATSFEVWRGTNSPYFAPGANCAGTPSSCTVVTTNTYLHVGGSGGTANNYTYIVRAANGAARSAPSQRTGEFDFGLTR